MAGLSIRSDVRELNPAKPRSNHRGSKFYLQISDFISRGGGTRTHTGRILSPLPLPIGLRPRARSGVYQLGFSLLRGAASIFGVGVTEASDGPLGYRVRDGAGEVEGCERVEAFDVATGFAADAGYPGSVAGEVLGVYLFDGLLPYRLLGGPDPASGLDAGDGPIEARAGDPEARRHLSGPFVLYDARHSERAAGGDAEGFGGAAELAGDCLAVAY